MTKCLNPKYHPPSRDCLANQLVPAWYDTEKQNVIDALKNIHSAAITSDGWTSITQDHYITVTLHFVSEGKMKQTVLKSKAVYDVQTGPNIAQEIETILDEFGVREKIVAVTVDNAANMNVAVSRLQLKKMACFAHTLNIAAQKIYSIDSVSRWCARIRSVIVWLKRSSMAKTVLQEKQHLLSK